jgi:hypothetical protein
MTRQPRSRRRAAITYAALLAAAVLVALAYCLLRQAPRTGASVTPPTQVPARHHAALTPGASPGNDVAQIRWMNDDGCDLPVSLTAGPHDTADGLASGFTDTPLGAVLAADNIAVRTAWEFGPQVFAPVIENQVTGQYQPDLYSSAIDDWETAGGQLPAGSVPGRQLGFAWQDYTPHSATVTLLQSAVIGGSTVYTATEVQVQWSGGDWMIVAPDNGDWADATVQVASPGGYTLFPRQGS